MESQTSKSWACRCYFNASDNRAGKYILMYNTNSDLRLTFPRYKLDEQLKFIQACQFMSAKDQLTIKIIIIIKVIIKKININSITGDK